MVDGIPILVPDVRSYVEQNLFHLTSRRDHSESIESLIGDAVGQGSAFDATRQHLSTYGWGHYSDLDPDAGTEQGTPWTVTECLARSLETQEEPRSVDAPVLDIGCSVGRTAFDLAGYTEGLVLGVDVNFAMLQVGADILRTGRVRYPLRRVGVVYDRIDFPASFAGAERVDFWACDAMALPFEPGSFGFATAFNVLDCVASPRDFLDAAADLLRPGSRIILSTPYDWSVNVTPMQAWIGGHSQRAHGRGASEPFLRTLLTAGAHSHSSDRLRIQVEIDHVPWRARLHGRSEVEYSVHVITAERT